MPPLFTGTESFVFVTISEGTVVSMAVAGVCTLPNVPLVCSLQRSDTPMALGGFLAFSHLSR